MAKMNIKFGFFFQTIMLPIMKISKKNVETAEVFFS